MQIIDSRCTSVGEVTKGWKLHHGGGRAGYDNLTLRLYGPQTPILDDSYRLPAVVRALWLRLAATQAILLA